jgi:predicted nucleotidyltransferase
VRINRNRLHRPDDPIHSIPQISFRTPVRVARHYIEDELDDVLGIVLFGSVARGEADRQSDIDLWILVDGDSGDLLQHRNTANKLARDIEGLQIPPTISLKEARNEDFEAIWPEVRDRLEKDEQDWESADRHSFEFIVETPQSILNQSPRVDSEKLFGKGITLVSSESLERVKQEVLRNE